ncbi:ATP-binding protein [Micromonospora costi]|uniref:ATP-binding protein n=1 Tax=Micromonospora costi TaxID=1530042 RepID=A0A3B0AC10_9ACTN|nr:AAA family ATPase [Micromonospora costi]RKN58158.1 ATP-binding protein [Micromonospora costi]
MGCFVGRARDLARLDDLLDGVRRDDRADRPGRVVFLRGRPQVGKSRLVEEFLTRSGVPYLYFTASAQPTPAAELALFVEAAARSTLPGADLFEAPVPHTWDAVLALLADALPADRRAVVVLDGMPHLAAADPSFEGTLRTAFDRHLSRRPVLVVGVGSDVPAMEALTAVGRPFHRCAEEVVVAPLTPAEVGDVLDLPAADALDAYLVCGGLPLVVDEWPSGTPPQAYLTQAVADPTSALVVGGERSLAADHPAQSQVGWVLRAIGGGARTFSLIERASGGLPQASLTRALRTLTEQRAVEADLPLSVRASRETRYTPTDPHLPFWTAFLGPHLAEVERGRADLTLDRIAAAWPDWRARAVEPLVREALRRLPPDRLPPGTAEVGGYWTRASDIEVPLVGADRAPVAGRITFVGAISWRDDRPFDEDDLWRLLQRRAWLPGADEGTLPVAVSRGGVVAGGVRSISPEELLAAYRD